MDDRMRSMLRDVGGPGTPLDRDRRARIDAVVEAAIAGDAPPVATRGGHRRVWYVTVAAAAACVLAVLAYSLGTSRRDGAAVTDAPRTDAELVQAIASSPTAQWREDQVLHSTTVRTSPASALGEPVDSSVTTTDRFVRRDGTIVEQVSDEVISVGTSSSIGNAGTTSTYTDFGPFGAVAGFTPEELATLPADPDQLVARIEQQESIDAADRPQILWGSLIDLSTSPVTPAAVRAAATQWLLEHWYVLDTASGDAVRLVGGFNDDPTTLTYDTQRGVVVQLDRPGATFAFDVEVIDAMP